MTDEAMRDYLWEKAGERRQRLFECACCRLVWQNLTDERSRRAVLVAEMYADGMATEEQLDKASASACKVWDADCKGVLPPDGYTDVLFLHRPYSAAAYNVAIPMEWWGGAPAFDKPSMLIREAAPDMEMMSVAQRILLQEIIGNPSTPVTINSSWLTAGVLLLARDIYQDRAFDRLPILANTLQEAGCDNEDILNHFRSKYPHIRGCWALDVVLGKS